MNKARRSDPDFLSKVAAPARRALEREKITTLAVLARHSEQDILNLHGVGPSTIPALKRALAASGLAFKEANKTVVGAFLASLDHPKKAEIEALRTIILGVDKRIREGIKWNAPSFALGDHFATFTLRPRETVQIVLHTGAKVKRTPRAMKIDDPSGLLKWAARDRCLATLADLQDIRTRKTAFVKIIRQWIAQL